MAASRSTNSARMRAGSRNGAPVPAAMRCTLPSVRNSAASIDARAFAAPLQQPREFVREMLDGAEHVFLARDRLGEAALRHIGRHRQPRRDRLVFAAERLVEAAHEIFAEARGERRARAVDHVGDVLEADLRESGDGFFGAMRKRGEGQGKQRHRVSGLERNDAVTCHTRATAQAQPTVSATAARA